jgi:hypothetical protein
MRPAINYSRAVPSLVSVVLLVLASITNRSDAFDPQEPLVTVDASTNRVTVAEPFTIVWTVTTTDGSKVAFPQVGDTLGDFDIIEKSDRFDVPDKTNPKLRTWRRSLVLESLTTGPSEIPSLEIEVRSTTSQQSLRSEPFPITVASVLEGNEGPEDFRDIQPVIDAAIPKVSSDTSTWWIVATSCVLAMAVGGSIALLRRRKAVSPRQLAITRLLALERSFDSEAPSSEAFAVHLSSIARDFLKMQFNIPQAGTTDVELLENVALKDLLDAHARTRLSAVFRLVDQAKFAGTTLSTSEMKESIGHVTDLVERVSQSIEVVQP